MVTALSWPLCGLCRGKESCWGHRAGTESARPCPAPGATADPVPRGNGTRNKARLEPLLHPCPCARYVNRMSADNVGTAPVSRGSTVPKGASVLTGHQPCVRPGSRGAAGQQNGVRAAGLTVGLCRLCPAGCRCGRREPCPGACRRAERERGSPSQGRTGAPRWR